MKRLKNFFSISLVLCLSSLFTGCKAVVLQPAGIIAADEKNLLLVALGLMLLVVIPVIILTLVIARRYRASNTNATYNPDWAHSTILEIIWWSIPCVIVLILGILTWITCHTLDPYRPISDKEKPMEIQAVSLEWKWLFIYPQQNIATVNFVEFPIDRPIHFDITSDAPMNSFIIQQLAGQIYSMNGMKTELHLIANQLGDYKGISANFSGEGFSGMHFVARVASDDDFNAWVKTVKQSKDALSSSAFAQLAQPSESNPVQYFALVEPNLFNSIIAKFMQSGMQPMKMASSATPGVTL